ncbi:MAG TPA: hypothetical protein VNJ04_12110 [Gemmatimonadaceae bacterium]|nr:hypothetical protein [Gemmatimonadaceae bacterium]
MISGVGNGVVAVDGLEIARGGVSNWLNPGVGIFQNSADDCLYVFDATAPVKLATRGANTLAAGGGSWLAWLSGYGLYGAAGLVDARACLAGTSQEQDGRGAASPDGSIAICRDQQSGVGFAIVGPGGDVTQEQPDTIALSMQVLDSTTAVWVDAQNRVRACGRLPDPAPLATPVYAVRAIQLSGAWYVLASVGDGLVLHPWADATRGWRVVTGEAFYPAIMATGAFTADVAYAARAGELPEDLRTAHVDVSAPMVSLGVAQPMARIGRALWCGFFEFVPASLPGNCRLTVGVDMVVRALDGRSVTQYVNAADDSNVDQLEAAIAVAKRQRPSLPVLAYWTRRAQAGRAPIGADIIGIEAYCGTDESLTFFEGRIRSAVERVRRAALIAQTYTSNAAQTANLAPLVPIYARIARDHPNVEMILGFSGSGRATGLQDHPEVIPLWQQLAAGITAPSNEEDMPTLNVPAVTVETFTLDRLVNGREIVFYDRANPELAYRGRVFVQNGSVHVEIRNAAGSAETGRRRPVVAVEPQVPSPKPQVPIPGPQVPVPTPNPEPRTPNPLPTPAPTDPWEVMVRETIRASYEQDRRATPSREEEDVILARCYPPPQGDGWQGSHIEAFVQALPRPVVPETPRAAFAGSIRRDGRFLVNDAGIFRPVFVSALSLLRPQRSDSDIRAYLDWAAATGFNGIRTFAGALTWAGQTPEMARMRLPFLLAEAKARGLYVEVTALTDTRAGAYDKRAHVRACAEISVAAGNVLFEIANETFHSTQDDEIHDPEYLRRLADIPRSFGLLCAIGAPEFDEPQLIDPSDPSKGVHFPFPVLDYVTLHLERGRDKWNMVRRVRELEAASAVTGRPVMNNEPIGADEQDGSVTGRQRFNDPAIAYTMALLNRLKEVGGLHHSQAGAQAELPGPVQQACADAFVAGSRLVPVEDRLTFKNARWSDSPIADADFNAVIRAYTGVSGDRAWTALVGLSGDPRLRLSNGWRIVGTLADRPGVQVVELAR